MARHGFYRPFIDNTRTALRCRNGETDLVLHPVSRTPANRTRGRWVGVLLCSRKDFSVRARPGVARVQIHRQRPYPLRQCEKSRKQKKACDKFPQARISRSCEKLVDQRSSFRSGCRSARAFSTDSPQFYAATSCRQISESPRPSSEFWRVTGASGETTENQSTSTFSKPKPSRRVGSVVRAFSWALMRIPPFTASSSSSPSASWRTSVSRFGSTGTSRPVLRE